MVETKPVVFSSICPACGAIIEYGVAQLQVSCPHCGNGLLVSSCDPARHGKQEIDPHYKDLASGVFQLRLHPVGTRLCVQCGRVYPKSFSCCPNLMELAISMFSLSKTELGPRTKRRLRAFVKTHLEVFVDYVRRMRKTGIPDEHQATVHDLLKEHELEA